MKLRFCFLVLLFVFSHEAEAKDECNNEIFSTNSHADVWYEFENYMKHQYEKDCLVKYRDIKGDALKCMMSYIEKRKNVALALLKDRQKGICRQDEYYNLASLAALCGRYDWMQVCLDTGDDPYPEQVEKEEGLESAFTAVISGSCTVNRKVGAEKRIEILNKMMERYPHLLEKIETNPILLAAQFSGLYAKDKGAMFDYLLQRGMRVNMMQREHIWVADESTSSENLYELTEQVEYVNCYALKLLLSVPGSCRVLKKHRIIEKIGKEQTENVLQYLEEFPPEDAEIKRSYIKEIHAQRKDNEKGRWHNDV